MAAKVKTVTIPNPSDVGILVVEGIPSTTRIDDVPKEQTDQDNTATGNPHAPHDGLSVTLEEYWTKWYANPYADKEVSYEWHNGRLEAKPLSTRAQLELYNWFFHLLLHYVESHPIASLLNLETGFILSIQDLDNPTGERKEVRKPDIGVIRNDNPVEWEEGERVYKGSCDMCVESVSDSTRAAILRDTEAKKQSYAGSGVREYYILDPSEQYMHCYRLNAAGDYEEIEADDEGVIRSEVLPGFQFRWDDLIRKPAIRELILDEVYGGYILPEYQAEVEARQWAEAQAVVAAAARKWAEEQAAVAAAARKREAAARKRAEEQAAAEADARKQEADARREAEEQAAVEADARKQAEEQAAVEADARKRAEEQAAIEADARKQEAAARKQAEEQATVEADARKQAEEQAAVEADARREAEEETRALQAELARLRQRLS